MRLPDVIHNQRIKGEVDVGFLGGLRERRLRRIEPVVLNVGNNGDV